MIGLGEEMQNGEKYCKILRKWRENMSIRVLFVCHGNICRSPMGEYILKDMVAKLGRSLEFEIDSAAVSREQPLRERLA